MDSLRPSGDQDSDNDNTFAAHASEKMRNVLSTDFSEKVPSFRECKNKEYFHDFIQQYTFLTRALNHVYSAMFIFRFKSRNEIELLWVNKRYKTWLMKYLGHKDIEDPTNTFNAFLIEEDKEQFIRGYDFFVDHPDDPYRSIHHRKDKDGHDLWLFINAKVIELDKKKKPELVVMMITDLTSEIESEIQLKNLLNQNLETKKEYDTIELTDRQKEVLRLIVKGNTNKEIAKHLKISSHTVDTHRKKLLAKFKIKNSATLVRVAFELGLQ